MRAFIVDSVTRYRRSAVLRGAHPQVWTLLSGEAERMRHDHQVDWAAGLALADAGGLAAAS